MHVVDSVIIGLYLLGMLAVGAWFMRRQVSTDEYFVGNRRMGAGHIGLSVVATDVGGGFSIGLGGLGFALGLAGSWLLFTGLVGAWLAAVLLIPRVKSLGDRFGWQTYPEFLEHRFDGRARLVAGGVSAVGYAGFVGAQILAGAKLSAAAFQVDVTTAVWVMAAVVVVYTALGGLEAVVYTDTVQWTVLFAGLLFLALPFALEEVGGLDGLVAAVPAEHLTLTNVGAFDVLTWGVTIVPIWFVGMTLYQRIYATRDVKTARRAWVLAGLLEYPLMAFVGVSLGLLARAMYFELPAEAAAALPPALGELLVDWGVRVEPEMGLPMLIRDVLPVGITGLVMAAYFSAIMSTADSCLLASVGNVVGDIYLRHLAPGARERHVLRLSRALTVVIGVASVSVALLLPRVLDAILLAYAFMVSGLFVPTLAGLYWRRASADAALAGMLVGGGVAVLLSVFPSWDPLGEPILLALPASALALVAVALARPARGAPAA